MPPLARSTLEARLYLELHPCACGEASSGFRSAVIELDDDLATHYTATCPRCGADREFVFRLPERVHVPLPGEVSYGDAAPSELLDPGEWLWVADRFVAGVPADVAVLERADRPPARHRLLSAAAAVAEAAKFIPPESDAVPESAFWSDRGQTVFAREPGRFFRDRLEVVRSAYLDLVGELTDR